MCQDKGALPHSFGIVIHAEAGGVELRDVVGRVVHDPIFLRCVSISTVLNCVNSEWRHCIQMCVLLINCPPPPKRLKPAFFFNLPLQNRLSAVLGRSGLLASGGRRGNRPKILSGLLLLLQKQHR